MTKSEQKLRRWTSLRIFQIIAAANSLGLLALVASGATTPPQIPDGSGLFHGCYPTKSTSRTLRLVGKAGDCKKTEPRFRARGEGAREEGKGGRLAI